MSFPGVLDQMSRILGQPDKGNRTIGLSLAPKGALTGVQVRKWCPGPTKCQPVHAQHSGPIVKCPGISVTQLSIPAIKGEMVRTRSQHINKVRWVGCSHPFCPCLRYVFEIVVALQKPQASLWLCGLGSGGARKQHTEQLSTVSQKLVLAFLIFY